MKLFLLVVALLPVFAAEPEGIECPGWARSFSAEKEISEGGTKYWDCPSPGIKGEKAVLKTCPEGRIYKAKPGICRTPPASQRLTKRQEGAAAKVKDIELLEIQAFKTTGIEIGSPYNARDGTFRSDEFYWTHEIKNEAIVEQPMDYSHVEVYQEQSIQDRIFHLNVEASLALGFMSGLIQVEGSAAYMNDHKDSSNIARVVLSYKSTKFAQTIPTNTPSVRASLFCKQAEEDDGPTHVVTSIVKGNTAYLRFDQETSELESVEEISGKLQVTIDSIPSLKLSGSAWIDMNGKEVKGIEKLRVKYNGDIAGVDAPTSFGAAVETFREIQKQAKEQPQTKTSSIRYQLTPLSYLCTEEVSALADISDNMVNKAVQYLVELNTLKEETKALVNAADGLDIASVKQTLQLFNEKLEEWETDYKKGVSEMFKCLRGDTSACAELECVGDCAASDFVILIETYTASPYQYDDAKLYLELRKREISTIQLFFDGINKRNKQLSDDKKLFELVAANNKCLQGNSFRYFFDVLVLPVDGVAIVNNYIDNKMLPEDSALWYNNPDIVGKVGSALKEFMDFGVASNDNTDNHCFVVRLKKRDPDHPEKTHEIVYLLENQSNVHDAPIEGVLTIPMRPPAPVCTQLYEGFELATASNNHEDVTMHYVEAIEADNDDADWKLFVENRGDQTKLIGINGLKPNTKYRLTTKYKLLTDNTFMAERHLGFSQKSKEVECTTAPTSPLTGLKVTAATAHSLTITWDKPVKGAYDVSYIIKVRKSGSGDDDSIINVVDYAANTNSVIRGLDPATLYEVVLHTESEIAESTPIDIKFSTAPLEIPYPEVAEVGEDYFELTEKLSLMNLPSGLDPERLFVIVAEIDTATNDEISGTKNTVQIQLQDKNDKTFRISGKQSGRSYSVRVFLKVYYGDLGMSSSKTEALIVTTNFGGTPVEQVEQEFEKLTSETDDRIQILDQNIDDLSDKVTQLDNELDSFISSEAMPMLDDIESVAAANYSTQEQIFVAAAKKACFEPGHMFYAQQPISTVYNLGSPQECLARCRENSACKGAGAQLTSKPGDPAHKYTCKMGTKRTGTHHMKFMDHAYTGVNRVCYDAFSQPVSKWLSCMMPGKSVNSAQLKSANAGFNSVYDCMLWCLRVDDCQGVTYRDGGYCYLYTADSLRAASSAHTSMKLSCLT